MKPLLVLIGLIANMFCYSQQSSVDFDAIDSLIQTTPEIDLCKKGGTEDLRFMTKTPEKYSNFKQEFMSQAADAFVFPAGSHFICDMTVEINCEGKAGNYHFAVEPRNFRPSDFENFVQLINLVYKLKDHEFKPAYYLGENVNSKVRFRLTTKDGIPVMQ